MSHTVDGDSPDDSAVEYAFSRPVCLAWTVFCLVMITASVVIARRAVGPIFLAGWMPMWLLGASGAVLFSVMAISWARRLLYGGPALVLGHDGIRADRRMGGLTTPSFAGTIGWDEIDSASPNAFGSVILRLGDPDAFWARQGSLSRMLAWHPSAELRGCVILGGHDVAVGSLELAEGIRERLDRRERTREVV